MSRKPSFLELVASWPKVPLNGIADHRGRVVHVTVRHDDWCAKLNGGICNCNPDASANLQPRNFAIKQ
jgi:hypothetical protein